MTICELCRLPIREAHCIVLDLSGERCIHTACMRSAITKAFAPYIGIYDDDISELVADAVESALEDYRPGEKGGEIFERSI